MAQFGGETAGGTIVRESLNYTSVKRIREVWPKRAKKSTDAKLRSLVRNPVALGDWAYGGRMGNRKGSTDGYDYRGGGFIQTTGKAAVADFCGKLGIDLRPDLLDDPDATLRFACFEWKSSGCNELADANDLLGISKAINTGSANSGIMPNGMEHRTAWFNRAKPIWWDADMKATETAPPPTPVQNVAAAAQSSRTVFGTLIATIGGILAAGKEVIADAASQIVSLAPAREVLSGFGLNATRIALIVTVAGCLYALYARLDAAAKGKTG
jgi:putative chitinase